MIPHLAMVVPGIPEMAIILVAVLLLFGGKLIPVLARSLGRALGEFKHARHTYEAEVTQEPSDPSTPSNA